MDFYTEDPARLKGRPKRTISDYVESNRILVPRRFDSLDDARKAGVEILIRSEHPQEYDGVSGLLSSFSLSDYSLEDAKDLGEVKKKYFDNRSDTIEVPLYRQYCRFLGLDESEFKEQASFSIWEKLSGLNRTVVADSSVGGRYHVMTRDRLFTYYNFSLFDNGRPEKKS